MKNVVMLSIVFCVAQNNAAGDAEKPPLIGIACKLGMFALKRDIVETDLGKEYVCAVARTLENKLTQQELQGLADIVFLAHSTPGDLMGKVLRSAKKHENFIWYLFYLRKEKDTASFWKKSEDGSSWTVLTSFDDCRFDLIQETKGGERCIDYSHRYHFDGKSLDELAQDALTELAGEDGVVAVANAANWVRR